MIALQLSTALTASHRTSDSAFRATTYRTAAQLIAVVTLKYSVKVDRILFMRKKTVLMKIYGGSYFNIAVKLL